MDAVVATEWIDRWMWKDGCWWNLQWRWGVMGIRWILEVETHSIIAWTRPETRGSLSLDGTRRCVSGGNTEEMRWKWVCTRAMTVSHDSHTRFISQLLPITYCAWLPTDEWRTFLITFMCVTTEKSNGHKKWIAGYCSLHMIRRESTDGLTPMLVELRRDLYEMSNISYFLLFAVRHLSRAVPSSWFLNRR